MPAFRKFKCVVCARSASGEKTRVTRPSFFHLCMPCKKSYLRVDDRFAIQDDFTYIQWAANRARRFVK